MARGNIAEAFADQILRAGGELTSEIELELRQNPNRCAGLTQFEITPDHKLLIGTLILKHEHSGPKEDFTDLVMQVRPADTPLLQALPRRALKEAEEIQMFVKLLGFDQTGRLNPADQAGKESLALRTSESAGELKLEIESELAKHPRDPFFGGSMVKTVAIYTRVSTDTQNCENQERELREVAERANWQIVEVYSDHGISGAKTRRDRPALDRMLKDASRRRFDVIACWSVDRLGRSLSGLIDFLKEVHALGIGLYLHQQGLDTTTPAGTAMFQMLGVFAEFERAMIRERVLVGLARARSQGKTLGRPRMAAEKTRAVRDALFAGGQSLRRIAKQTGVSLSSVQRVASSLS